MKLFTYSIQNVLFQPRAISMDWELRDWQIVELRKVVENSDVAGDDTFLDPVSVVWYRKNMPIKTAFIGGLDRDELHAFCLEVATLADRVEIHTINPDGTPRLMVAAA